MKARLNYLSIVFISYILNSLVMSINKGLFVMWLTFYVPLIILILSSLYSRRYKFDIVFSVVVGLLFLPLIIYPYNNSALIYTWLYGAISLIGQSVGFVLRKYVK